ncbi:MAG TPA: TonB family protein [Methylomirabilota bacterium]|nr:TonB family protein [Methylomirabilota bacterium]
MNTAPVEPHPWSPRRWGFLIVLCAGLHISLIWLFSEPAGSASVDVTGPSVRWLPGRVEDARLEALLELEDPTLFALAHSRGFSGQAWMKLPESPEVSHVWSEPPQWLRPNLDGLGEEFKRYARASSSRPFQVVGGLAPRPSLDLVLPSLAVPAQSTLVVEGAPAGRGWMVPPPVLRSWPHSDVLSNSVVEVGVNAAGDVETHRLLSSSGLTVADQEAMRTARTVRFRPMLEGGREVPRTADGLMHGRLIFRWRAVPPAPTTAPSGEP